MKRIIITGGAGFIGSHLTDHFLNAGIEVIAIDNFHDFYDPGIKWSNLASALQNPGFQLINDDILNIAKYVDQLGKVDAILHLAARAGVRPSFAEPHEYFKVNHSGTLEMLEFARKSGIRKFIYASSSSVYGINPRVPWSEDDYDLQPISPYAVSKIAGEKTGFVYSQLYDIQFIALRFFTVFGPRQRPDLAIHKFTRAILEGNEIPVYGDGSTSRDYTYVDDIIAGVKGALQYEEKSYDVFNLGNNQTLKLNELIEVLERKTGKKARRKMLPDQPGDVPRTFASIEKSKEKLSYLPSTPFEAGIDEFLKWYHRISVR